MLAAASLYLLVINWVTFAAFASDKRRAVQGARRVPELTLLQMSAMGGIVGALAAQRLLRHKTRKEPFRSYLWLVAALQALILAVIGLWPR